MNDFVYITDDAYSANDIKQMELRILKVNSLLKVNFGFQKSTQGKKFILTSFMANFPINTFENLL